MKRKRAELILNMGVLSALVFWTIFGFAWINDLIPDYALLPLLIGCGGWLAMWIYLWIMVPVEWSR